MVSLGGVSFSLTPPNNQGCTLMSLLFPNVPGQLSFTDSAVGSARQPD